MNLFYQENWETIKKRLTMLWDNEILDRPCVSVRSPRNNASAQDSSLRKPKTLKEYYLDPECILERNLAALDKTYLGGDALPAVFPYWGCGGHAKYLMSGEMFDKNVGFAPDTIWIDSVIEEYEDFDFNFDKQNPVFQAELQAMKFLAEEGKGKFLMTMPDNCGSYDGLAALRGNEDFIMDLLDQPDAVKKAGNKLVDTLIASGDELFAAIRENNDGGSTHGWMNLWSPGKVMQLQCDLSVMISSELYRDFIVEELERTVNWLDHSVYHLDGIEQTRFLDLLLSIKRLNMIQWTQVDGQPDITHNFHHIRRIQESGKGVVLIINKSQLDAVLDHTSPRGRMLIVDGAKTPEEADSIVDHVAKHSFQKTLF